MPDSSGSPFFLVIDQGTSSTKCFLFNENNNVVFSNRIKHPLSRSALNHVECDANEIVDSCFELIQQCVDVADQKSGKIINVGIALQRSTFLFWDKKTCDPQSPALSWQDSRAYQIVDELSEYKQLIHEKSGVPLSAHFGGAKHQHLTRDDANLKSKVDNGDLWFGPLSAFLVHRLTGHPVVDHTIAGRSQLMDISALKWDDELCSFFDVNQTCLPTLVPPVGNFGRIQPWGLPLNCIIGDQQSALIGQGGLAENFLAMNFGTSGSVLFHSGNSPRHINGLLNNVLFSNEHETHYVTEGSINACNSLFYWLEGKLNIPHKDMEWDKRCSQTETKGVLVPGFSGLAAPYWKSGFDSIYHNLKNSTEDEIVRAGMESIGFLVHDILNTMNTDLTDKIIPASGGGARKPLLQFISDITGNSIGHSSMKDRTAFGVFSLLKKAAGEPMVDEHVDCDQIFTPKMDETIRESKLDQWHSALKKVGVLK